MTASAAPILTNTINFPAIKLQAWLLLDTGAGGGAAGEGSAGGARCGARRRHWPQGLCRLPGHDAGDHKAMNRTYNVCSSTLLITTALQCCCG